MSTALDYSDETTPADKSGDEKPVNPVKNSPVTKGRYDNSPKSAEIKVGDKNGKSSGNDVKVEK